MKQRPVTLHLTSGRSYSVGHPEFASFAPTAGAREFILYLPQGGFEIISLGEIASVIVGNPKTPATPAK